MKLIDKLLTEWAYRVHDGMPDPSNPLHLINLDEALSELKIPRKAANYIKEKIRRYVDNPENRKLDRVGEPWGSKGDKSTTSEPSTSEPSEPSTTQTTEEILNYLGEHGIIVNREDFDSEEELKILAEIGEEEGTLQEDESDIIQSIFEFDNKTVGEIITPRVDMIALESNASIDEAMDIISEKQFSKIPIYKNNIDNISGILYAKAD